MPEVLSKSGEKLSAADYLDAHSLNQLMKEDDKLITKIFVRMFHELEEKDNNRYSYGYDSGKNDFLRSRERDLLFRYGLDHDASRELDSALTHVNKSFKDMQRQIEREREHTKQMDLSL